MNEVFRPGNEGGNATFTIDAVRCCSRLKASKNVLPIQSSEGDFGIWAHVRETLISGRIFAIHLGMKPSFVHMHQRHLVLG